MTARLCNCLFLIILLSLPLGAAGSNGLEHIESLPPGEQYRQLSLILLIEGGADPVLLDALGIPGNPASDKTLANVSPDDYKTPLIRIVDQESMLAGAAFLLQFARESKQEIQASLARINAANPVLISMVNMTSITEDAIIIRNAIADAIGYANLADEENLAQHLQTYRTQTIRLRNVMEYEIYNRELDQLTEEAIASVGGKMDAYQRMFDEEVDSKGLDRQFDAAKYIFNRTEKFDVEAGLLTEEIMKNVILSQSNPNNP
ncbi:MAG: hypothetical protein KJO80_06975 [Gammaproteobacteria bacterium]|nr:hypothetical protein [Gammaproteobacteria bacterium]